MITAYFEEKNKSGSFGFFLNGIKHTPQILKFFDSEVELKQYKKKVKKTQKLVGFFEGEK